jgi:hypothetical protein
MKDEILVLPENLEGDDLRHADSFRLKNTHGWVLEEIGLHGIIQFIRPRIFNKQEEMSVIRKNILAGYNNVVPGISFTELPENPTKEEIDQLYLSNNQRFARLDIAFKAPRLYRVRVLCSLFVSAGIRGQPSIINFIQKWMANSNHKQISGILRMRKSLYTKGLINSSNDNPDDIQRIYLDIFSSEYLKDNKYKNFYELMLSRGHSIFHTEEVIKKAVAPPESEWKIQPDVKAIDSFTFDIRRKDDLSNIFIGEINDCCMQIGHCAQNSLFDSITNPMSAIMVISKNGLPIGHSWLRLGESGILYLDNIELLETYLTDIDLSTAIYQWANDFKLRRAYPSIKIGKAYSNLIINARTEQMTEEEYELEFGKEKLYTDLIKTEVWVF